MHFFQLRQGTKTHWVELPDAVFPPTTSWGSFGSAPLGATLRMTGIAGLVGARSAVISQMLECTTEKLLQKTAE
jgi:hypothetical protein